MTGGGSLRSMNLCMLKGSSRDPNNLKPKAELVSEEEEVKIEVTEDIHQVSLLIEEKDNP